MQNFAASKTLAWSAYVWKMEDRYSYIKKKKNNI